MLAPAALAALDADLDPADFSPDDINPDCAPPDGEEGWLAQVPSPLLGQYLTGRALVPDALAVGFTQGNIDEPSPGFGSGGAADQMLPGAALAALAGKAWRGGLDVLSDDELVGAALAARRTASWQAALELACVSELASRRERAALASGDGRAVEHFGQEIAVAFTLTGRAADAVLALAAGLERVPQAAALLAAGVIDRARAVVIADELACLDPALARSAADRVLPRAGGLTTGQLRAALRRAALAGRDLPPAGVIAADRHIDAAARWLKDHGATGTLATLRAAVFLALLSGQSPAILLPSAARAGTVGGRAGAAGTPAGWPGPAGGPWPGGLPGLVHLTMPLAAWAGQTDAPGEVPGLGPLDAGTCRDLGTALAAHLATRWCLTLTDRRGRAVAHVCSRARARSARHQPRRVAGRPDDRPVGVGDLRPPAGERRLPAERRAAAPDQDQESRMRPARLPPPRRLLRRGPHRALPAGRAHLRVQPAPAVPD